MKQKKWLVLGALATGLPVSNSLAHESLLETVYVQGRQVNLLGDATSASEGVIGQDEIALRPMLRTGDLLEFVPGMVVTQHSGTGKANQYFLRGFNLDHGTDFNTTVDDMPVNMRSHGHGQGYTDLNFVIPETIGNLAYKKGTHHADVGDFSGAGSAAIRTLPNMADGKISASFGMEDYWRLMAADSFRHGKTQTLLAAELTGYNGPWRDIEEDARKTNVLIKNSQAMAGGLFSIGFMGYDNQWNSADQIPERAVTSGLIDELGSLDLTLGGESSRYSLNAVWSNHNWRASVYALQYAMNLWSNFTYYLESPLGGDQFEQVDDRRIYGGQLRHTRESTFGGIALVHNAGLELRIDDIREVGLYQSQARSRLGVVRSDDVTEQSLGAFWQTAAQWNARLRSTLGVRFDYYDFDVQDRVGVNANGIDLSPNTGRASDGITSIKGSIIYTLSPEWELNLSAGQGFHSNDARGTTIQVDPATGDAVEAVDPLVRSVGYEMGVRGFIADNLNLSATLWALESDSELVFVGDAGNTEASGASKRYGVELASYYYFDEAWSLDVEYANTKARFSDAEEGMDRIPGAIEQVLQAGVNYHQGSGWYGSLRVRYFSERDLVEDGSYRAEPSQIWNMKLGYKQAPWQWGAEVLNLTDSRDHDIDYLYSSRLPGEPADGVEDLHYHVMAPRTVRLTVSYLID